MGITRRLALAGLAAAPLTPAAAQTAEWPSRPVRFVVPYPPGGPTDIMGRVVAQRLTQDLPQPVVVENRTGASGSIGSEQVARAAPDGTVFLVNASAHVILPHMLRVPYDALADFVPVTNIASVPLILVVTPSLPVHSVAELIAYAKANPGRLSFASSSNGGAPHLAGELFKLMAGVEMMHVPYRGSGQALPDLIAGNVQVMFDSMPSSAGAVREGRLRPLAVTTEGRQAAFPDLPTIAEAGLPGYEISTWYGIWAPARTPADIVARLQAAVAAGLRAPEAQERMAALGAVPVADSPEHFAGFVRREFERWGKLVRDANIRAD
ncbi:tripartite tricarboxylate transporter substrate binding protein [Siccirubricoccus sp. G192]|uniref:Bug family tripartite tricarboxylate transporter substrate binding protein n=1 Tax=Siccirubricoccus sp. G192 TaxID=2849651 RepID=UPI0020C2F30B|nr:tripartite tricarboxylate transporter substrate binding protein [Siccirubricoccus sp. G192]